MQTKWYAHSHSVERELPEDFLNQYEKLSKRMKYLVDYGWKQSTADSFASAKNAEEFEGKLNARIDKILAGEMVIRDGGTRTTDPVEKEIKRLVEEKVAAWNRERKAKGKPKASAELLEVFLNRLHETKGEEMRAQAEAIVAARNEIEVDFSDIELPE